MSGNVYGWSTQPPIFALLGRVAPHISQYNVAKTVDPQLNSPAALKSTSFSNHLRCTRFRDKSDIR